MAPPKRAHHHPRRSAVQKGKGKRPSRHPTKRIAKQRRHPLKRHRHPKKKRSHQRRGIFLYLNLWTP